MIKKIFISLIVLILLAAITAGAVLYWFVVVEPGDEISKENIRSILGRESPVYYSDGVTPLGVFFADAHRQYVDYAEIPKHFIDALVAAEDNRFFSHFGFDVQGIARAAVLAPGFPESGRRSCLSGPSWPAGSAAGSSAPRHSVLGQPRNSSLVVASVQMNRLISDLSAVSM